MIQNITLKAYELSYLFGDNDREIELNLGSVKDNFWGENISMVSAIVGKNGTGKSSLLKYFKGLGLDNIIYYSPHLDYNDNYNFDVDFNDISLDNILRRDLQNIIKQEKEPNANGWSFNPKEDLLFLNNSRQMDFLSSRLCKGHPVFSQIFEGLKFGYGKVFLRGTSIDEKLEESFHNTPYQFRDIILSILKKCDQEKDKWIDIRQMENNRVLNQGEINAYLFKRNIIISFLSIVIDLMESQNDFLSEGICEIEYNNGSAINIFRDFVINAKVHYNGQSKSDAHKVFASQVLELFDLIYNLVDEITNEDFVSRKSFTIDYNNLENITKLHKEIINHLSSKYYGEKVDVYTFLGSKATDRNLSSGENSLLNFYSVLYEFVQKIDLEDIANEYILLLDEADLGYHPEWKKRFVNSIVKSLPLFFKFSDNQSTIQIIFTTHDPLTLSDIPRQNVIFLNKNGEGETFISYDSKETFGANIHDLLADSFFISDGLMGDFAKEKIDQTILWLRYKLLQKEIGAFDNVEDVLLEQKERELNEIESENIWIVKSSKELNRQIIDLIDEPLLRYKMNEMYYQIFPDEVDKEEARRRIIEIARSSGLNIDIRE